MPFDEFKNGYSIMCLNLQSGSELPRYNEIGEGHEFDEDQLKVDGHAWVGEPAEDDEDSEGEIEGGATGGDDEEVGCAQPKLRACRPLSLLSLRSLSPPHRLRISPPHLASASRLRKTQRTHSSP